MKTNQTIKTLTGRFIFLLVLAVFSFADGAEAGMLSTKKPDVNIRSGPGTSYEILWQTGKYYPIKVLAQKGKWLHFEDFEQDKGWVYKPLTGHVPSMVIKVNEANVRSGPGKKYTVAFKAAKGVSFKVLGAKGKWVHVKHEDGDSGWVYRTLLWGYTR